MGREKAEKRKRRHSSHNRSHSDSPSDESASSSTESSSTEESDSTSDSDTEEERHRRSKKRRRSDHKRRDKPKSGKKKRRDHVKETSRKRERISIDDYYSKSAEFRTWLSEDRGLFFSDLSSSEARKVFKKFVRKWNDGLLKKKYYKGIQSSSLDHTSQTKYKWKFAPGLDRQELKTVRDSVSSWTGSKQKEEEEVAEPSSSRAPLIGPARGPPGHTSGGLPSRPDPFDREEKRDVEKTRLKKERKELRQHHEMVLDELLPKATGHAARIEKKRARAEQRREREASPETKESVLMGGESVDIQKKIRARHEARQHKAQAAVQKISDYQAKEKAKMAALLEMARANKKEGAMW